MSPEQDNSDLRPVDIQTEKSVQKLRKEYVVVGKRQVTSWKAWLAIGILAGIVAGIALVASNPIQITQQELTATKAQTSIPAER